MKLIWILWQKIKTYFWNYAHPFHLYHKHPEVSFRIFLKPLSCNVTKRVLKGKKIIMCNCLSCHTLNNERHTFAEIRWFLRDSWRLCWTNPFKMFMFYHLYNYMTVEKQHFIYVFKYKIPDTFRRITYESVYLFFYDILRTSWELLSLNLINLIFFKKIKPFCKSLPKKLTPSIEVPRRMKFILQKKFFSWYKSFWFQQFCFFTYRGTKTFLVSALLGILVFMILIISLKVNFLQNVAAWIIFGNIFFWLMSGFNFFIKRGRFGKFTSRLQRFWKHAFVSFWVIEGFLFSLFFYYYLNSSQEPLYMYDKTNLNNDFVLNLQSGFLSTFLLSAILFGCHLLTIFITVRSQFQSLCLLLIISIGVFYLFFLESYQIYYVFNGFSDLVCVFDEEQNSWAFEIESIKLRTKQYYFVMCVIAKFWHFIFIFFSWVFFLLKSLEVQKITYNLLSFNYQNLLILFVLNMLCYCNWLHFLFRRFFDLSYFWFFTNPDQKHLRLITEELVNIILSCFNISTYEMQLADIFALII